MNRIYKVVWSKAKQCYVVVSELAKGRTKASRSNVFNKILASGVLACVLNFSIASYGLAAYAQNPFELVDTWIYTIAPGSSGEVYEYYQFAIAKTSSNPYLSAQQLVVRKNVSTGALAYFLSDTVDSDESGLYVYDQVTDTDIKSRLGNTVFDKITSSVNGSDESSYTAGNGITISSDNKVSVKASDGIDVGSNGVAVKAGTNVTVNANGVSVTGNGSVADGNTGLINGDKLYDEVRSSANGNYVIQLELYNFISSFPLFCSFLTIP